MSGHCCHGHLANPRTDGVGRLSVAVAVNVLLTIAQIVGGILSGSLALIADALHNLSDAMSLVVALVARSISRKPADHGRTFGYKRAESIGALINLTALIVIGVYLLGEAVMRLLDPEPIHGWIVVIIAGIALVIDLITAGLTYSLAKDSANVRAAFIHNLADALGSLAVIIAGTLIILFDWTVADVIATFLIAGYAIWQGWAHIGGSVRILMQATPDDVSLDDVVADMMAVQGVDGVHHVHVWLIDEHTMSLEAHVVIAQANADRQMAIKDDLKAMLHAKHRIGHSTLEFEVGDDAVCEDAEIVMPH